MGKMAWWRTDALTEFSLSVTVVAGPDRRDSLTAPISSINTAKALTQKVVLEFLFKEIPTEK